MSRQASGRPRPRRRFGQHFLVDPAVARQIVDLVQPQPGDLVLEIGPGRGALTGMLAKRLERLVVVEIDRDLAALLRPRFEGPAFRLLEDDVLRLDLDRLLQEENKEKLFLVGNLPYNITAPLLFRLLDQIGSLRRAVLMLQREVAYRLVAHPGTREFSLLSVLVGMRADVEILLEVGPQAFRPRPRVDSAMVGLDFRRTWRHPVRDERMFFRLVRAAFGQKRKMLRNSLLALVRPGARRELEEIASSVRVDLSRRPETLSLAEFAVLSDAFTAAGLAAPGAGEERD